MYTDTHYMWKFVRAGDRTQLKHQIVAKVMNQGRKAWKNETMTGIDCFKIIAHQIKTHAIELELELEWFNSVK